MKKTVARRGHAQRVWYVNRCSELFFSLLSLASHFVLGSSAPSQLIAINSRHFKPWDFFVGAGCRRGVSRIQP